MNAWFHYDITLSTEQINWRPFPSLMTSCKMQHNTVKCRFIKKWMTQCMNIHYVMFTSHVSIEANPKKNPINKKHGYLNNEQNRVITFEWNLATLTGCRITVFFNGVQQRCSDTSLVVSCLWKAILQPESSHSSCFRLSKWCASKNIRIYNRVHIVSTVMYVMGVKKGCGT
jgi:hypothetical protein